jgi:nucleoside 2-deoxyribosyltransferase
MRRYIEQVSKLKSYGYDVLCPMIGKEYLKEEKSLHGEGYFTPSSNNHAIKARDMWMVRQSDILLADFSSAEVASIGSCMELAWANMLGKHVISIIPEDNVHRHAFILECSDIVFTTISEAYIYLRGLVGGIN